MLYFGFIGKFLPCKYNFDQMNLVNKLFEKATKRIENECDILEVMDEVRRSRNF